MPRLNRDPVPAVYRKSVAIAPPYLKIAWISPGSGKKDQTRKKIDSSLKRDIS